MEVSGELGHQEVLSKIQTGSIVRVEVDSCNCSPKRHSIIQRLGLTDLILGHVHDERQPEGHNTGSRMHGRIRSMSWGTFWVRGKVMRVGQIHFGNVADNVGRHTTRHHVSRGVLGNVHGNFFWTGATYVPFDSKVVGANHGDGPRVDFGQSDFVAEEINVILGGDNRAVHLDTFSNELGNQFSLVLAWKRKREEFKCELLTIWHA
mmetsp:Transcript_19647/g.32598  ORF Transcript_19647/g.32598 Transcript_19647/m.32598 type:complete len:206 (+) Transcript_19647:237-854(+)